VRWKQNAWPLVSYEVWPRNQNEWPQKDSLCPNQTREIWPDDRGNDGCGHFPDMAMIRKDSTGIFGLSTAFVKGTLGLPRWPRRPRPRWPRRPGFRRSRLHDAGPGDVGKGCPQVAECRGRGGVDKKSAHDCRRAVRPTGVGLRAGSAHDVVAFGRALNLPMGRRCKQPRSRSMIDARPT
jgi:hypothetical protein